MITQLRIFLFVFLCILLFSPAFADTTGPQPNVVIILADDLGIGDTGCYGATVHKTPNIDSLAENGIRFTQGYATSATCTPSRYAFMTGVYPIRHPNASILPGNAPLIIDPKRPTLPRVFKEAGYATFAVGKWHLGLADGNQDWNKEIRPGLCDLGFDHSFIMAATNDRTPTVYIEDQRCVGLDPNDPLLVNYRTNFDGEPTGKSHPELLTKMTANRGHVDSIVNGIGRIGFQKGSKAAYWIDEDMADIFNGKALGYVRRAVGDGKPFFLYYGLHQPHCPRVPHSRFVGSSPLGPRGDVIVEADWQVGELLQLLRELNIEENTIVILTSDNGMVLDDGYNDMAVEMNTKAGHTPSGILRGGKYSRYDGGMHVPFLLQWKGTVKPGVSDAVVCQIDFLASFAKLTGRPLPQNVDSIDTLDAFLGRSETGRKELVLEANRRLSFRTENWYLVPDVGQGAQHTELFDLSTDPSQKEDVAAKFPEQVEQMTQRLKEIVR
ncbi:MAG: sulfatase-like hydrolase/transferase [Planctomycetaceae bacterium]|nr:sulfatase-like hydrolase/transferase [Planctomycetaceae bacterium]